MFLAKPFSLSLLFVASLIFTMASLKRIFSRRRSTQGDARSSALASNTSNPVQLTMRKPVIQHSPLLDLPDEILVNIVSFLDADGLRKARTVCSHLDNLAQPFLYESFDIFHGKRARGLVDLLRRNPRRSHWLKSIMVSVRHDEDAGVEQIPLYLSRMQNLRDLILETPDCNARTAPDRVKWVNLQRAYESVFRQSSVAVAPADRALPNLESCTLHFVDDQVSLYPLTKYSSIFLHPTLKSLTVSCACTDHPGKILKDYRQYKHTTALQHLHLEECDFDPASLEVLLKFPKALKSLKISEGVRYNDEHLSNRPSRLHGNLNPSLLSYALTQSVAHSLETLSLSLGYQRRRGDPLNSPGRSLDLTQLTQLKQLDVSMTTLGLIITRPDCDHATYRRLPPSLEHIRVFSIPLVILRGRPQKPFQPCFFTQKATHGLPNLNQVTFCYEYQSIRGNSSFGLFQQRGGEAVFTRIIETSRKRVIDMSNKNYPGYASSDVHVVLEVEVTPPGFIPPYLHTEEKPVRETIWDSEQPPFEALIWQDKARKATQPPTTASGVLAAAPAAATTTTGTQTAPLLGVNWFLGQNGVAQAGHLTEEEASDDDDEEEGFPLMHLPPQAAELFELLIQQPGIPFQL